MNKITAYFKKLIISKTVGFYIGLGVMLLSIVSLVAYLVYVDTNSKLLMMPWVIVFIVLTIVGEISLFFYDNDYLPIAIASFPMLAFGFFVKSPLATLWSIVSYLNGASMEGANPDNFELIIMIAVLLIITSAAAVTACFFNRVKHFFKISKRQV